MRRRWLLAAGAVAGCFAPVASPGGSTGTTGASGGPPAVCLIDGTSYPAGAPDPLDGCQLCEPVQSASAWSPCPASQICSGGVCSAPEGADGGSADGGSTDGGAIDAGPADGGSSDGGLEDAGVADSGIGDAGSCGSCCDGDNYTSQCTGTCQIGSAIHTCEDGGWVITSPCQYCPSTQCNLQTGKCG
ncbi:MAG: hypothetical protein ACYDCL_02660 [Myxococcales bacterium]